MHRLFAHRFLKPLVVGCLLLIPLASLQAQPVLTLEQAIQEVLHNNKALQQARNQRKIATLENHISQTALFPILRLPHMSTHWHQAGPPNTEFKKEIALEWTVTPSSLFSYQKARTEDQISELTLQQKLAHKVAETTQAYYALVLAQQKQQMYVQYLETAQETLQLAKAKYEVGQETELDYLDAQLTYDQAQATFLKQETSIEAQKRAFCRLIGWEETTTFVPVADIPLPEHLHWETLLATYQAASPALLMAQKQYESANTNLQLAQADRLFPSLNLTWRYTGWEEQPKYEAQLTFNLTHIFQYATHVRKERLQAANHRLKLADVQVDTEEKLRKEFLLYTQNLQNYALQQRRAQVSQARAEAALAQYRLGSITLLQLKEQQERAQKITQQCMEVLYTIKSDEVALRALAGMPVGNYEL